MLQLVDVGVEPLSVQLKEAPGVVVSISTVICLLLEPIAFPGPSVGFTHDDSTAFFSQADTIVRATTA